MYIKNFLLSLCATAAFAICTSCSNTEKEKIYPPLSEFMYADDAFLDKYTGIEKFTFVKQFTSNSQTLCNILMIGPSSD